MNLFVFRILATETLFWHNHARKSVIILLLFPGMVCWYSLRTEQ